MICLCGTPEGYPHEDDCPYPCYNASGYARELWYVGRKRRRIELAGPKLFEDCKSAIEDCKCARVLNCELHIQVSEAIKKAEERLC